MVFENVPRTTPPFQTTKDAKTKIMDTCGQHFCMILIGSPIMRVMKDWMHDR